MSVWKVKAVWERAFLLFCTHGLCGLQKRRVVKPHPLKWEGRGCVLSVIQAGFPCGEKEEGREEGYRREEKIKQRVRDTRGRERITVNMSLPASGRKVTIGYESTVVLHCDESGWLQMNDDGDDDWCCVFVCVSDVTRHSHLQDSFELLQFRFLLLDLAVVVLAQFDQQQAGDVQDFLETRRHL